MALTLPRWIALALAGLAIIAVIILGLGEERDYRLPARETLTRRVMNANARTRQVAEQLLAARLRDSVVRALQRSPVAPGLLVSPAFDAPTRRRIDTLLARANRMRPSARVVPVTVVVLRDGPDTVRGQPRSGFPGTIGTEYLLPDSSTRGRCVVIARVRGPFDSLSKQRAAEITSDNAVDRLLGPCAFVEQFGAPGPHIRAWLRNRAWAFAQKGTWREPPPWALPDWVDARMRVELHDAVGPEGLSCAAGSDEACLEAILRAPGLERRARPERQHNVVSTTRYNPFVHGDYPWFTSDWPLGAREWILLSDMVRTLGVDRFERFWRSDLPVQDAFAQASGQSLTGWTRNWIATTYMQQAFGPSVPTRSAGLGTLLIVLGVALSLRSARARQVG